MKINDFDESEKPTISIPSGATGAAAGLPFEKWFKVELAKETKHKVFDKLEFAKYVIGVLESKNQNLNSLRKNTWWAKVQQFTPATIERIKRGEEPKLQQPLGDVAVMYGDDLNDVLLLNIKATEAKENGEPVGRPPNIVSAMRLLKFFVELFDKKPHLTEKANVWLVGFDYIPMGGGKVRIEQAHFKSMLKLDLEKAPPINFDAAIQIQWHLNDMVEDETQSLGDFAKKLANKYRDEWKTFTNRRTDKLENIIKKLLPAIEKVEKNSQTIL